MNFYKCDNISITDSIWAEYAQTKDIALRNQILTAYLYIVTCNVKKMNMITSNREDIEDMTNQGVLELMSCIDRYDYTRGIQFDTFSSIRVRGSIIDYIRKKDWVPRDARKRIKELNNTEIKMQDELGRTPRDSELCEALNISEKELHKIRSDELSHNFIDFEDLLQNNQENELNTQSPSVYQYPEEKVLNDEFKRILATCIDELDKNERTVISLYYYDELKLNEIAFVLNLSTSRISQIHSKALKKLEIRVKQYLTV